MVQGTFFASGAESEVTYGGTGKTSMGSDRVFSASRGNSVVEVGWQQVARAELAVCHCRSIAVVAEDLKKCYEYVRFNKLVEKGARHEFPLSPGTIF